MTIPSATGSPKRVETKPSRMSWRVRLSSLGFGALFVLLTTATLAFQWPFAGRYSLRVGEVSTADIRAPRYVEYISPILTEEARQQAERRVADFYEPARRARAEQVNRSREVLSHITVARDDADASQEEKAQLLKQLANVDLTDEEWAAVLALDDAAWKRVEEEVPSVLNTIMLGEIRESQLPAVKRQVPAFINLTDDAEAQVAASLVRSLLKPNMVLNEERTAAARQEAHNTVTPQTANYAQNEIIVRQGDVVTALHVEALEALGLNQPGWDWVRVGSALILSLVFAAIFGLYLFQFSNHDLLTPRRLGLLVALLAAFLLLAKLMVPGRTILPYVYPLAAASMLISTLLGLPLAFLVTAYFGLIVGSLSQGALAVVVYAVLGALIGALVLGRGERTSAFVRAGGAVGVTSLAVLIAFNLRPGTLDMTGMAQLLGAAVVNAVLAASLTLISLYLLGAIFDIATPLRLMELARPNHPLLRDLITKAPGTYHHSLLVSNLAEQAAEAIGADAFLTRIGAYYHDIGKLNRPYFFVENQIEGVDPHAQLDPWSSAQIIISHVKDGLELARRHKLPRRIRDFIAEHQGTGLVRYFYVEAVKEAGEDQVDEKDFRYPGPRPRSKETALLMLADSCESAVRGERPDSKERIDELVRKIIEQRLLEGELGECQLTLQDLDTVRRVMVRSLQGVHHPRIAYPQLTAQRKEEPIADERPQTEPATVTSG